MAAVGIIAKNFINNYYNYCIRAETNTVEPLYSGQFGPRYFWPFLLQRRGFPFSCRG